MPRLCLVTALAAESRPWLDALKLRQIHTQPLRLYGSDSYLLLETGVGKLSAAAAIGALLQTTTDITHLVNIGIAGGHSELGSLYMAHQIVDVASGAQWFPHLPPKKLTIDMQLSAVHTVDQPAENYQAGMLFDMEASAVVSAASRYLSTSQIHCIKVVSDNPTSAMHTIDKKLVKQLMGAALPAIAPLLEGLMHLPKFDNAELQANLASCATRLLNHTHHSTNDQIQLHRLIHRYHALAGQPPCIEKLLQCNNAKGIRKSLQEQIERIPLTYDVT